MHLKGCGTQSFWCQKRVRPLSRVSLNHEVDQTALHPSHRVSMHWAVLTDVQFLGQQKEKEIKKNKKEEEEGNDAEADNTDPTEGKSNSYSDCPMVMMKT